MKPVNVKISTKVPSDFKVVGKQMTERFHKKMQEAFEESSEKALEITKRNLARKLEARGTASASTSPLYQAATTLVNGRAGGDFLESAVYFEGIDYLSYAEYGRRPGEAPPYAQMKGWFDRHGIEEKGRWKIIQNIRKKGTKGLKFMAQAANRSRMATYAIYNRKIKEFLNGN